MIILNPPRPRPLDGKHVLYASLCCCCLSSVVNPNLLFPQFRNNRGKVIKPLQYQSTVASGTVARVEPNIKWFGKYRPVSLLYKCMSHEKVSNAEMSKRRFR